MIHSGKVALAIWTVRREAEPLVRSLADALGAVPYLALPENREAFRAAFQQHRAWVFIGTTGIAVRYLDGLAVDKRTDPAVVVLDEAARFAVSLLAGHEGGANALAYRVAELTGAVPVITTATEALKPLVLGIGCRKGVNATQIDAAVAHALAQIPHGAKLADVREVATVDLKADEPGLREWCAANALPVRVFSRETLAARNWVASPSDWVRENIGLDGVCEPCALLAAPRSKLILPKTSLNGVTVAIAEELV